MKSIVGAIKKSEMYKIKSGYWIVKNILNHEPEVMVSEPNITKFQAFTWKINAAQKCII